MSAPWVENRSRLAWWAFGALLLLALVFVVRAFVGTFVFGVFLYYATRPVYRRLSRRVRPPSLAAIISLLLLALPALLLLAYVLAIGVQELTRLSARYDLAEIEAFLGPYLDLSAVPRTPEELLGGGGLDVVGDLVGSAGLYLGILATALLHLFVMIAIAFYLLRDDHRLSRWVHHHFDDDGGVLAAYLDAVDRSYHQIFFGNIVNAVMTAVIGVLAYSLLDAIAPPGAGIPYPAILGLLAGLASLIPVVGMKLVYVPATVYLLAASLVDGRPAMLWLTAAFAGTSFLVVDTIPDLVLRPYVSGRNLHVGMVMLAYIFGPLLFGWYGIFLGPMLLVLIVHFARLVLPELVAGVPIEPAAADPPNVPDAMEGDPGDPTETPASDDAAGTSDAAGAAGDDSPDSAAETGGRDADARGAGDAPGTDDPGDGPADAPSS